MSKMDKRNATQWTSDVSGLSVVILFVQPFYFFARTNWNENRPWTNPVAPVL